MYDAIPEDIVSVGLSLEINLIAIGPPRQIYSTFFHTIPNGDGDTYKYELPYPVDLLPQYPPDCPNSSNAENPLNMPLDSEKLSAKASASTLVDKETADPAPTYDEKPNALQQAEGADSVKPAAKKAVPAESTLKRAKAELAFANYSGTFYWGVPPPLNHAAVEFARGFKGKQKGNRPS